ncbi:hypothetical protein OUZ56_027640 [Daphnia magna]|uniref:Secreted protein n=1 Tax=Daphnia magna TaxID=35525 RepID=A0ABR0B1H9_9CRUS|nr:hypothetical protein OUZ56_027640 [Daphnia magna]
MSTRRRRWTQSAFPFTCGGRPTVDFFWLLCCPTHFERKANEQIAVSNVRVHAQSLGGRRKDVGDSKYLTVAAREPRNLYGSSFLSRETQ